jgi:hypothetical protein
MNKKKRFTMRKFQNVEGVALQMLKKKGVYVEVYIYVYRYSFFHKFLFVWYLYIYIYVYIYIYIYMYIYINERTRRVNTMMRENMTTRIELKARNKRIFFEQKRYFFTIFFVFINRLYCFILVFQNFICLSSLFIGFFIILAFCLLFN